MILPKKRFDALIQIILYTILFGFDFISYFSRESVGPTLLGRIFQLIVISICLFMLVTKISHNTRITKFDVLVNLLYGFIFVMSIILNNQYIPWLYKWIVVNAILLSANVYWKDNPQQSFYILSFIGSILVYINALLVFLYPDGLYENQNGMAYYLMGNYNVIGAVSLLVIAFQSIYTMLTHNGKWNLFLLVCTSIIVCAFLGSMTSSVGLICCAIYFILCKRIKHTNALVVSFFIFYAIVFIGIVVMGNSIESYPFIVDFIENVLGKDSTFTQRTTVWFENLQFIVQRPLTGWGNIDYHIISDYSHALGTHNLFLAILLQSGIIGLIVFVGIIVKALSSYKNNPNLTTQTAVCILCILLIMSFFEQYNFTVVYGIIIIAYYSRYLTVPTTK